jgi:hypothetical protein
MRSGADMQAGDMQAGDMQADDMQPIVANCAQ